jgi:hypothetical protein
VAQVAHMGEERKLCEVLVGKSEKKKPLARPRRRSKDGIRTDLRDTDWGCGVESVGSEQGPVLGSCKHCDEHSGSGVT